MWSHKGFSTIVFTDYDVSMKYRGLFELKKKEVLKGSNKYKNKLTYQNQSKIFPTRKDALLFWLKKESKHINKSNLY